MRRSTDDVKKYLLNGDTCKCGLGKRINLDKFDFTPPPPIKIRLRHLGAGAWSPASKAKSTKKTKIQQPTLAPPQTTNNTVKRASGIEGNFIQIWGKRLDMPDNKHTPELRIGTVLTGRTWLF